MVEVTHAQPVNPLCVNQPAFRYQEVGFWDIGTDKRACSE